MRAVAALALVVLSSCAHGQYALGQDRAERDAPIVQATARVMIEALAPIVEALQAQGVEVRFQSEDESSSEYLVAPPGREAGLLTSTRICTAPESRAAQSCRDELTLAFELP